MRQVIHVISEFISCQKNREIFTDAPRLEAAITEAVKKADLSTVAVEFYQFEEGGVTGSVVLAESHVNIHTWPERDYYINLDISVCNYQSDNTQKALRLYENLRTIFQPLDHNVKTIKGYKDVDDDKYTEYFSKDYGFFLQPDKILANAESEFQQVAIYNTEDFGLCLRLDNYFQTSERDEFFYHESLVHPAMVAHPNPKNVLIIGGGDGGVLKDVLKHNTVEKAVMVEIDGKVVEVSKQWLGKIHQGAFDDKRTELHIADGMKYAVETKEKFDVIILDLTDPIGPAKALYTKEFYQSLKDIMRDDKGLLSLHTEYPFIYPHVFGKIQATLKQIFKNVDTGFCFIPLYGAVMSFGYASDTTSPKKISPEEVAKRIQTRGVKDLQYYNEEQHFGHLSTPQYAKQILAQKHEPITKANSLEEFMQVYNQTRGNYDF